MPIKERFKEVRTHLKLKQSEMAEALGIKQASISSIENTGMISIDTIEKIGNVYNNISVEWLITGKGDMIKGDPLNKEDIINYLKNEIAERDKKIIELNDRIITLLSRP